MHNKSFKNGQDIVHISPLHGLGFSQPTSKFSTTVHTNTTHPPLMHNKASEKDKQCAQSTTQSLANLKSTSNAQQSFRMDTTLCTSALFMALSLTQTSFVKVREREHPWSHSQSRTPKNCTTKSSKKASGWHSLTIAQITLNIATAPGLPLQHYVSVFNINRTFYRIIYYPAWTGYKKITPAGASIILSPYPGRL